MVLATGSAASGGVDSAVESSGVAAPTAVAAAVACDGVAPQSASCVIESLHRLLAKVTAGPELSFEERCDALTPGVVAAFDVDFMALKSLGPHGGKLSDADRRRWVDAFARFTAATYARRLGGSRGRGFEILEERPARKDTVLVRGQVVGSDKAPVSIDYRMHQVGGAWKIVDVYANGTISQLALRRAEVASLLDKMSFEEAVVYVEDVAKVP